MTKFKIFAPSGIEVCTIEAVSKVTHGAGIYFYGKDCAGFKIDGWIAEIPGGWVAIPDEIIVKNENKKTLDYVDQFIEELEGVESDERC